MGRLFRLRAARIGGLADTDDGRVGMHDLVPAAR
jgi:hypothetical protein